jgi:hypothetical protein
MEALTNSFSPTLKAKKLIINSVAFPKVALRIPPKAGLVWAAKASVPSPSNLARGTMARADRKNRTRGEKFRYLPARVAGIKIKRMVKILSNMIIPIL